MPMRKSPSSRRFIGPVILVLFFVLAISRMFKPVLLGDTIAIVDSKVLHIVSWNAPKSRIVLFDIPLSTVIDGVGGYGRYAIGSLYALDQIDRRGGRIFMGSLANALGLPISGTVKYAGDAESHGSLEFLRRVFSWKSIFFPSHRIGIDFSEWFAFVWSVQRLHSDSITIESVDKALIKEVLADDSSVFRIDPARYDFLYGKLFFDSAIRSEKMSVSVFNSTAIPGVGQSASRFIANQGITVISVGNDTKTAYTACRIFGMKKNLQSLSALLIIKALGCEKNVLSQDPEGGVDLQLYIGSDYVAKFFVQQ